MRSVTVRLDDLKTMIMNLGFVGENEHTRVMIDAKKMYDQYPHASASLTVCPPSGASYPAVIERDGDMVIWDITDSDLTAEGSGEIQLSFTAGEVVAKTYIGRFRVSRSIMPTGEIPEPLDDFLTRAGAALTAIPETIDESLGQITAEAETLAAGSSATAAYDNEAKKFSFGIPKGDKGDTGDTGAPGYSPSAGVSKSGDTATITITDRNGTTTASVKDGADGKDGKDGQDGAPGADGYSPSASVSKTGTTATITITDKTGTTSAQISDGDPTALIDDTAGSGDTDKVWSADKSATEDQALKNDLRSKADVIINTKSGSIVTLTDAIADEPLTDCVVQIVPVQSGSGDPSPTNIRPISGWTGCNVSRTGKNLLDFTAFSTYSNWKDNLVGYGDFPTNSTNRGFLLNIKPSVTYTISFGITLSVFPSYLYLCSADGTSSYREKAITTDTLGVTSYTFTAQDRIYYLRMGSTSTEALFNGQIEKVSSAQLEIGSSASSYEAFSGTTYSISWQTEAGTVYGGNLNLTTGVLTVDRVIDTINGNSAWYAFETGTGNASAVVQLTHYLNCYFIEGNSNRNGAISSTGKEAQNYWASPRKNEVPNDGDMCFAYQNTGQLRFHRTDVANITTLDAFKNAFPETQVVYKLATPITYQLTPVEIKTLLSNPNNIWADTGDVSVSYKADTKSYIDQNEGVKDVQVAGSSVVTDGVANVPLAGSSTLGVVKTSASYGLSVDSNGRISTSPASSADIKNPDSNYKTVGINRQHESVFYGLAKAANADMASLSSVTVGQYPEAQKAAIRKMLGIPNQTWEKIAEYTVPADSAQVNVNTDLNGQSFKLSEMYVHVILEPATTGANDYVSFRALVTTTNDLSSSTNTGTRRYMANGAKTYAEVTAKLINGICVGTAKSGVSFRSGATPEQCSSDSEYKSINGVRIAQYSGTSTLIPKDSVIEVYGIRIDE